MKKIMQTFTYAASLISLLATGCGGSSGSPVSGPGQFALTVASVNPVSGVTMQVSPADVNGAGTSGSQAPRTSLSLIYSAGTAVTLTAPSSTGSGPFVAWAGCDSTSGVVCNVTMNGAKSVQAEYTGVSSITIVPSTITVAAGGGVQIPATVNGFGTCTLVGPPMQTLPCAGSPVTYNNPPSLPAGVTGDPGTVDTKTGYYTPAATNPASSVNVTAQSNVSTNIRATVLIELQH
jgi:hypothetical protein